MGRVEVAPETERLARLIAFWHGAKIVDRVDGVTRTIAARHGYGNWEDSPSRYAEANWRQYVQAAEAVVEDRQHADDMQAQAA